ncbi:hypothetical protein NLG97_g8377 [Lecanicillium saksenae]|uniref:Uncharacterized protein n=1 Tax=Lecanicillium saksenae TaxID=468837 RepID=A0ACC1QL11_9HYPO|nr:hypothetical protein NLG97_g8377 [Lecanicillium saksenae]
MVQPIVQDQYVAARAYFGAIVGLLFLEGAIRHILLIQSRLQNRKEQHVRHWRITTLVHRTLTCSLPIPLLTAYSVPDVVRFVIFAALNVIFALNDNQYTTDYKLYGWLTIANGGLALLLAARSNLFSLVLRIPGPVLLQYHRWIGLATVSHATVHVAFNIMHFVNTDQIATNLANARIRVGLMAWICLALIFLTALPIIRRRYFELFYYTHFLFFVFMVGALYHTTNGPEFLLPGFSLWVVDRAIRLIYGFRKITVERVTYYEGDLTKLQLSGARAAKPGQIVWLQLLGISFAHWHPFTVASVAPDSTSPKSTVAIRGIGGYTLAVQRLVEKPLASDDAPSIVRIRLDGPYGVGRFNWYDERLIVLVAGGVGITPGLSISSSIIHGAANSAMPIRHIYLLWIVKEVSHIAWFAEELRHLQTLSNQDTSRVKFNITVHVTRSAVSPENSAMEMQKPSTTAADPSWRLERGRPNIQEWFGKIIKEVPNMDAAVNVCGPHDLVRDVRRASVVESCHKSLFRVEEESFER